MITMNETEYLNTCEYVPHYIKMVHTTAPRSNFALTSHKYTTLMSIIKLARFSLSRFSQKFIVTLVSLFMKI